MNNDFLLSAKIRIVSGEGENGTIEEFKGRKTARAIAQRIKKEERSGRWARAEVMLNGLWVNTLCFDW